MTHHRCEPIMLHGDRRYAACRGCDWRTPAPGATQATIERLYAAQHPFAQQGQLTLVAA